MRTSWTLEYLEVVLAMTRGGQHDKGDTSGEVEEDVEGCAEMNEDTQPAQGGKDT